MTQITKLALTTNANTIKNETTPSANTGARVGQWLLDAKDSLLGSYFTDRAGLEVIRAANQLDYKTEYRITDATAASRTLIVYARSTNGYYFFAIDPERGKSGIYILNTDVFIEQGRIATAPTVTNDEANGYYEGEIVTTLDTNTTYICTDASTGAAVWKALSGTHSPTVTPDGTVCSAVAVQSSSYSVFDNVVTVAIELKNIDIDFSHGTVGSISIDTFPIDGSTTPIGTAQLDVQDGSWITASSQITVGLTAGVINIHCADSSFAPTGLRCNLIFQYIKA